MSAPPSGHPVIVCGHQPHSPATENNSKRYSNKANNQDRQLAKLSAQRSYTPYPCLQERPLSAHQTPNKKGIYHPPCSDRHICFDISIFHHWLFNIDHIGTTWNVAFVQNKHSKVWNLSMWDMCHLMTFTPFGKVKMCIHDRAAMLDLPPGCSWHYTRWNTHNYNHVKSYNMYDLDQHLLQNLTFYYNMLAWHRPMSAAGLLSNVNGLKCAMPILKWLYLIHLLIKRITDSWFIKRLLLLSNVPTPFLTSGIFNIATSSFSTSIICNTSKLIRFDG